jgi:ATP-binding cassette subfamily B protein
MSDNTHPNSQQSNNGNNTGRPNMQAGKQAAKHKPKASSMFGGGNHMMMRGEKANNFKDSMRSLIGYMRPYWTSMVLVLVLAIASTIFAIVSPKLLGEITNQVVNDYTASTIYDRIASSLPAGTSIPKGTTGGDLIKKAPSSIVKKIPAEQLDKIKSMDFSKRPAINYGIIKNIALLLIVLYLLSSLFSYIQGWIMARVSQETTYRFRRDISEKINKMPLKYFDSKTHGEILSRVTNDVDTVSQTLNQSLAQIVTSVTMLVGIIVMMLTINWLMTLVMLLTLPLSFAFIGIIVKKSQKLFIGQQTTLGRLNGHIEEMYSGHNVMKAFNGEKLSVDKFKTINNELYHNAWKSQFLSGLMWPVMILIGNLGYVAIAVLGGALAIKGTVNIGDIQAFMQYMRQFSQPITQVANIANILQSTAAAAERVFEFLNETEEVPEAKSPANIDTVAGEVVFDNVVFGYNPDANVIKGFNALIRPGQKVAIVGPTGAGKTTIVNLLMRFYDVNEGSVKIDGIDIRDMKRSDLRKMFGMVLQDTWLFNGTIRENIAYGNLMATDDEIFAAARSAHADHFIRSLPKGYDLELNEEADNISQGEKQLITIARAMLADPPMLILDEATSSVDTRTEILIQTAMEELMVGRTSFVIAHRLSTIRHADLILVMDDGNIIEQGTHEELIVNGGLYSTLYNSQFAVHATA